MTVGTTVNREDDTGNDAVDTYSGAFRIFADTDVVVYVEDLVGNITKLTLTTDYTVAGLGLYSGFSITLANAGQAWLTAGGKLKSGYKIALRRKLPLTQLTDLRNRGGFYPEDHETVFDRLAMIAQQHQDELDRSLKFPETDGTGLITELPSALLRAGRWLACDLSGNIIASAGGAGTVPISAFAETVVDDGTGAAMLSTIVASAGAGTARGIFDVAQNSLTSGKMLFPAIQIASADANALDDYEEGVWAPTLGGTSVLNVNTKGRYVKIGRMVFIDCYFQVTTIGTGNTAAISGLPFPVAESGGAAAAAAFLNLATAVIGLNIQFVFPVSQVNVLGIAAAATASGAITNIFGNESLVAFSGCYMAAT